MMIRLALPADAPRLAAFLAARIETSMFLLGNLEAHGIGAGDHPHATTCVLAEAGGRVTGVLGCSTDGVLMVQAPGIDRIMAERCLAALGPRRVAGITGDVAQVAAVQQALRVPPEGWRLNSTQPLCRLELAGLSAPEVTLRAPGRDDLACLTDWFAAYLSETGTAPQGDLRAAAAARAEASVAGGHVRLMTEAGVPVAMCAINAQAGSAVQVGGVFVPPALRGAGRGGAVVAGRLAQARSDGATLAILFAASPDAAHAYRRIGFRRIGDYRVALLRQAMTLSGVAA